MKLRIDDKFLSIIFDTAEEEQIVKDNFTFDDLSAVFVGGTFDKRKIKRRCLIISKKQIHFLNSGFLTDLLLLLKTNKCLINLSELIDARTNFSHQFKELTEQQALSFFPGFKYVNHQIEALKKMLRTSWGIIEMPTSSGKSEVIIAFIKATKLPTLVIVNRISLAIQLRDRLQKNEIEAEAIYGETSQKSKVDVVIATIGSIGKITNLPYFKVLILDESHHASSKKYQEFLKRTSYPLRFAFSATPSSGDKYKFATIRQYLGNIIYKTDVGKLIENEVIARPKIHFVEIVGRSTKDWVSAYFINVVHNDERNKKIKELVEQHNLQTLILIRIIEHGKELNNLIPNSVFVSGIDDAIYRKEIIEKFENGEIPVIISSNIFNEGISINAIKLLIIASGGKSRIETIQKLGRGLRIKPDKSEVLVYDFLDTNNIFTERHSIIRKSIYERSGFEVID